MNGVGCLINDRLQIFLNGLILIDHLLQLARIVAQITCHRIDSTCKLTQLVPVPPAFDQSDHPTHHLQFQG